LLIPHSKYIAILSKMGLTFLLDKHNSLSFYYYYNPMDWLRNKINLRKSER